MLNNDFIVACVSKLLKTKGLTDLRRRNKISAFDIICLSCLTWKCQVHNWTSEYRCQETGQPGNINGVTALY